MSRKELNEYLRRGSKVASQVFAVNTEIGKKAGLFAKLQPVRAMAALGIRVNKGKLRQSRNNPCRTGSAD